MLILRKIKKNIICLITREKNVLFYIVNWVIFIKCNKITSKFFRSAYLSILGINLINLKYKCWVHKESRNDDIIDQCIFISNEWINVQPKLNNDKSERLSPHLEWHQQSRAFIRLMIKPIAIAIVHNYPLLTQSL